MEKHNTLVQQNTIWYHIIYYIYDVYIAIEIKSSLSECTLLHNCATYKIILNKYALCYNDCTNVYTANGAGKVSILYINVHCTNVLCTYNVYH